MVKKFFPVPYKLTPLFIHVVIGLLFIYGIQEIEFDTVFLNYLVSFLLALIYAVTVFWYEWKKLWYKTQKP